MKNTKVYFKNKEILLGYLGNKIIFDKRIKEIPKTKFSLTEGDKYFEAYGYFRNGRYVIEVRGKKNQRFGQSNCFVGFDFYHPTISDDKLSVYVELSNKPKDKLIEFTIKEENSYMWNSAMFRID